MTKGKFSSNWSQLDDFGKYWEDRNKFDWYHRPVSIVRCHVTYFMRGAERKIDTEVHFHHEGKIYLADAGWLNSIDHYVEFKAEYQDYEFTPEGSLRITDSGPKLGPYWVEIRPL